MGATVKAPCSGDAELWMSDLRADQREAAQKCRVMCPRSQYYGCREEGFNHEFGVWGGMTPGDRKREDPKRYEAGLAKRRELSDDIDRIAKAIAASNEETKPPVPESERQEAPPPRTRSLPGTVPDCAVDECPDRATRRGWCTKHYHRWRNTGKPEGKSGKP